MEYDKAFVAVDPVIFAIIDSQLNVLLKKREKEPFKNKYELPGGLLAKDETAEETLSRKLKNIAGETSFFVQFNTFSAPERDPRGRTISIGFIALVNESTVNDGKWFPAERLPEVAFDHKTIITTAQKHLQENLDSIVRHFLPDKFPINMLQLVHEVVKKEKYDNRNFRKKIIASGIVQESKQSEKNVSHRPAKLYKFVS